MSASELHGTGQEHRSVDAHMACGDEFPSCGGEFLPFGRSQALDIHLTHRALMYVAVTVLLALFAVVMRQRRRLDPDSASALTRLGLAIIGVMLVQVLLGAVNVWAGEHAWLIVAHLAGGALLWVVARAVRDPADRRARAIARGRAAPRERRGGACLMEAGTGARPAHASWLYGARELVGDYVALTKPRVISLLLVTTAATMFVADPSPPLGVLLATLVGGYLAAGGAGAINHYIERDIDARMSRTSRRPLPSGRIEPRTALWFGIALGALSFTAVRAGGEHDRRAARDGGAAGLRLRLHAVAEAAHDAEHRDRRRGRRGASTGRVGGGERRPRPVGVLPVRDRLLLDASALLGAGAADQGRVRAHGHPDAARSSTARPRPGARSCCTDGCCWRSRRCRSRAACSARSTRSPRRS